MTLAPSGTPESVPVIMGPGTVTVPILLYHRVAFDPTPGRYSISVAALESQLDYLVSHGYQTVTVQDVVDAIQAGAQLPEQPVVLTFDDGHAEVMDQAFPRMQARNMVGVVYVVANRIGAEGFLSAEELRVLHRAGWEIGSHGMTHAALEGLTEEELTRETALSKATIESALGEPIDGFAYPFGIVTDESARAVWRAGYRSGAGLGLVNDHRPERLFYLSRREVRGTYSLEAFIALLGRP